MNNQQIQETFSNINHYASQIGEHSMPIHINEIRKIKDGLTQISMDIANEELYLSRQIVEIRDKLFRDNGTLCLGVAGRIVEILMILMQENSVSENTASTEEALKDEKLAVQNLNIIFSAFHKVARQLKSRHGNRKALEIKDEYDVQDLLHALLRLYFDDIRAEEWTPSYGGGFARVDFLLKNEKIVIEVKKTRDGLRDKELGEQLIIDIAKYRKHPDCKKLVCFVYDPEERICNPVGIMNDLNTQHDGFVTVIIKPSI